MPATPKPTYAGAFHCIGPACEDPCCGEWTIPLDQQTFAAYQTFPADRLGTTVGQFVFRNAPDAPAGMYANIYREPSGRCPFYGADRLCQIQQTYGPLMLSASCSIYPRSLSLVGGELEGALSLSCPEAARQVLLNPSFLSVEADLRAGTFRTDNVFYPARDGPAFHPIRNLLIEIVRDRTRTLADRLLLIGSFVQQLDRTTEEPALEALLERHRQMIGKQVDPYRSEATLTSPLSSARLDLTLALTTQTLADPEASPRFRETFWTFIEGIGSAEQAAPGDDLRRFREAEKHIYRPFLTGTPHLLENYLINHMLQHLFPFGRTGSTQFATRSCSAEWVLLALQFAWLEALLIGIAAARQKLFATDDLIRTVQTFTRATEHDPAVLEALLHYAAQRELNTLESIATLLTS